MTTMTSHLRRTWHRYLALLAPVAALAILLTGIGAALARFIDHGGFHPGPIPPRVSIAGGTVPSSVMLSPVRIHNQGSSNSCVGQTLATIAEIIAHERGAGEPFSAGFIYDQINHGRDTGASWEDAFRILTGQGDAPLAAFPHDGRDWWVQPGPAAIAAARPHRVIAWRSIDPSDTHTIQLELSQGRPLGLAIPVHQTFANHGCTTPLTADSGPVAFWHAVTVIGYSPRGLRVLNSWGPSWGCQGQGTITWPLLHWYYTQGASIVVAYPPAPQKPPKPTPRPRKTPTATTIPAQSTATPTPPISPTFTPVPLTFHGTHCHTTIAIVPARSSVNLVCHYYRISGGH